MTFLYRTHTFKQNCKEEYLKEYIVPAEFPGGKHKLSKFVARNVKYPLNCRNKGYEGKVLVTFTIGTEGKVRIKTVTTLAHPDFIVESVKW